MSSSNQFHVLVDSAFADAAADSFIMLPPRHTLSWADEKQEEIDAEEAVKASVFESKTVVEEDLKTSEPAASPQGDVASPMSSVDTMPIPNKKSNNLKETDQGKKEIPSILSEADVPEVALPLSPPGFVARPQAEEDSKENAGGSRTLEDITTPDASVVVELSEDIATSLPHKSPVVELITPATDSWDEFIVNTPAAFTLPLANPESKVSASNGLSYAKAALSDKPNVVAENEKDKVPRAPHQKPKMKSFAQRRREKEASHRAAAAAKSDDLQTAATASSDVERPTMAPSEPPILSAAITTNDVENLSKAVTDVQNSSSGRSSPLSVFGAAAATASNSEVFSTIDSTAVTEASTHPDNDHWVLLIIAAYYKETEIKVATKRPRSPSESATNLVKDFKDSGPTKKTEPLITEDLPRMPQSGPTEGETYGITPAIITDCSANDEDILKAYELHPKPIAYTKRKRTKAMRRAAKERAAALGAARPESWGEVSSNEKNATSLRDEPYEFEDIWSGGGNFADVWSKDNDAMSAEDERDAVVVWGHSPHHNIMHVAGDQQEVGEIIAVKGIDYQDTEGVTIYAYNVLWVGLLGLVLMAVVALLVYYLR